MCVQVTGEANETQICEALRRYSEREGFVREALFHLFSLTHVMEKPRPDILKVGPYYCTLKLSTCSHSMKTEFVLPFLSKHNVDYHILLFHHPYSMHYSDISEMRECLPHFFLLDVSLLCQTPITGLFLRTL